jgi:hypothetical protein
MIRVFKVETGKPERHILSLSKSAFKTWLYQWEDCKIKFTGYRVAPYRTGTVFDAMDTLKSCKSLYLKPDSCNEYVIDIR